MSIEIYPDKQVIDRELHQRPFFPLSDCENMTMLTLFTPRPTQHNSEKEQGRLSSLPSGNAEAIAAFCAENSNVSLAIGARYFFHDFGTFRLRWQRHTEFETLLIIQNNFQPDLKAPFAACALSLCPQDFINQLTGQLVSRVQLVILPAIDHDQRKKDSGLAIPAGLSLGSLTHSSLADGRGAIWTDFIAHPTADGQSAHRILIENKAFRRYESGRIAQRVLEVETYRAMSLMSLSALTAAERKLELSERVFAQLSSQFATIKGYAQEEKLFSDLSNIWLEVSGLLNAQQARFSASLAYAPLIEERISHLREGKVENFQRYSSFLLRRFTPAIQRVRTTVKRIRALETRVAEASAMIRTRTEFEQEKQSAALLESSNRIASQQLHMQSAVEGLSVIAITYYAISLLKIFLTSLDSLPKAWNNAILIIAIPLFALMIWRGIKGLSAKKTQDKS